MKQAGYDGVLVPTEQLRSLVERNGCGLRTLQSGAHVTLPLDVHRLDGTHGCDEIWYVIFGAASTTPRPDVLFARGLGPVFELADLRKVPLTYGSECPSRQVRLGANLSETGSERLTDLLDWCGGHRQAGSYSWCGIAIFHAFSKLSNTPQRDRGQWSSRGQRYVRHRRSA
jgi:hypothetical protein